MYPVSLVLRHCGLGVEHHGVTLLKVDDQSALRRDPLAEGLQRAVGEDAPFAYDHHAGAEGLYVVHVVRGENDGDATLAG